VDHRLNRLFKRVGAHDGGLLGRPIMGTVSPSHPLLAYHFCVSIAADGACSHSLWTPGLSVEHCAAAAISLWRGRVVLYQEAWSRKRRLPVGNILLYHIGTDSIIAVRIVNNVDGWHRVIPDHET
jgi:hypothetical protein